ncbi:hypothetical protein BUALT_Bualt09G0088400 [Buddleja alternifolia]|uniref:Uncharacterized protein n=1 Tax=Buddleja alternifolia TaxID=168488 RepID=A0AAV6XBV9_9LAMI|nr:hypothetical protein BUALT_Bualt09G0088400 [Buddleja alternifolia]
MFSIEKKGTSIFFLLKPERSKTNPPTYDHLLLTLLDPFQSDRLLLLHSYSNSIFSSFIQRQTTLPPYDHFKHFFPIPIAGDFYNKMKNISICYNEHAIKVSDSYCSGPSNRAYSSSHSTPSIQNAVVCIYKIKLSTHKQFRIKLTWSKTQLNQGFSIGFNDYPFPSSKFIKNSGLLRKARGTKFFDFNNSKIEVIWDLYHARYETGPEPINGFYVVVLVNSELTLILGDLGQESEIKKRVSDLNVSEFSLISRSEHFSGNSVYATRAKFCDTGPGHDILIKYVDHDRTKVKSPVLSVYIDKKNVIEVKRLQWNFRGNQTIFVDGLLVDLMWDVHDWFYRPTTGYAVFMFRTRSGLDSRLWLEEKKIEQNEEDKVGFSLLICACKNPD